MSDYYSHKEICDDIKPFENELKDIAARILWRYGNANVDDIVQDVYLEACAIYLNSTIKQDQLKKEVIELCEQISFGYYRKEQKNLAKPVGTFDSSNAWLSKGDSWMWDIIEDNTTNPLSKLEAIEKLETFKTYKNRWMDFEGAKNYVQCLELKSVQDWNKYCSNGKLKNLPDNPDKVYKKWVSWEDWLGIKFYTYDECVNWVSHNLIINDKSEWSNIIDRLPRYIPINPDVFYKDKGWDGWNSFLGLYQQKEWEQIYLPYKDALKWVEDNLCLLRLTEKTWIEYAHNLPFDIPPNPQEVYKNKGWAGWYVWLGTGKINGKLYKHTYHTCMEWVKHNLPLMKTKEEWQYFIDGKMNIKKPDFIPPNPEIVYRNIGWNGWNAFFRIGASYGRIDNIFHCSAVRVYYMGAKIWVKPISVYMDTMIAVTITVFSPVPPNTRIEVKTENILSFKDKKTSHIKTRKILKEKYGL